jgi:PAS domain S-box-containing protein
MNSNEKKTSPQRALVVSSEQASREVIHASLEEIGCETKFAETLEEGLEQVCTWKPDAVFFDLEQDRTWELRDDPRLSDAVIIVCGEPGQEADLIKSVLSGADDYLLKPIRKIEIKGRLEAWLGRRRYSWLPEEQEALLDLSRLLASSLDMDQLLHLVAVRTAKVLKVDRCSLVLIAPSGKTAQVAAASEDATLHGVEVLLDDYPEIQEVIRTRRPFVVDKVEKQPALKGILNTLIEKGIGSLALFPMIHENKVDGVLFLRSERFSNALQDKDRFFASAVAASVSLALRNLQAVENERWIANELKRTKQFMENLIGSSVDAIIAADLKGNIILFNEGAEKLFGYRADEVVGKIRITHLYPSGIARKVMEQIRSEDFGGVGRLVTTRKDVVAKDGDLVPVNLTAWWVTEGGEVVATAGIFTDLREMLKIEQELSQAQELLMKTEKQAVVAEMAGATAHELNQPLTSMMGYAELAKRKIDNQREVERILNIILSETERMADIVRKISRITKYETKSYVGEQRIIDIDRSSEPE